MSHDMVGKTRKRPLQEWILEQLAHPGVAYVTLRHDTRSQTTSMIRAARSLESEGKVVVLRLLDGSGKGRMICAAFLPGAVLRDGRTAKEWATDPGRRGRMQRQPGSLRTIRSHFRGDFSLTTIWRDVKRHTEQQDREGKA